MRITINGTEKIIPSSLDQITLRQKIDFHNLHGKLLDKMLDGILSMPEDMDKQMELIQFHFEKMIRTLSFFTGCTPEAIKETEYLDTIVNLYWANLKVFMEDEQKIELKPEYVWLDEVWTIHPPLLKQESRMTFGEFIDAKQVVKDFYDLGKGRWEALLPLCAIFFRKKGEAYQESFLYEGSERLQLTETLPLDKALCVAFFLTSSLNGYLSISRSSGLPDPSRPEDIRTSILTAMGGSTF